LNTLFKFSFLAWLLLATAGGPVLLELWWVVARPGRWRLALMVWRPVTAAVLALGLVYPVVMPFNFTEGFRRAPTLDGLAELYSKDRNEPEEVHRQQLMEYEAARWLSENLRGKPIVLEAVGGDYSQYGRVSARTGLPTLLGWPFHEAQERGGKNFLEAAWDRLAGVLHIKEEPLPGETLYVRQAARGAAIERDVETIYRTANAEEARALLDRYRVSYVYIGRLELEKYGGEGLGKFDDLGHPVYRNAGVTIYRVGGVTPALGRLREVGGSCCGAVAQLRSPRMHGAR
jgi:uncharacterized membrane protein